jgi:hypothetical protein
MWIVPDKFMTDVIKDEDQRLDLIKNNLMVWGEFVSLRAWKNRKWNKFFQIKTDSESFNQEYSPTILKGLEHDPLKIEDTKEEAYADLPFLCMTESYGHYQYVSGDSWELDLESESKKLSSLVPSVKYYWPTPVARDHFDWGLKKPYSANEKMGFGKEARNLSALPRALFWESDLYGTHNPNPRWVEQMMGLPIGWTDPYL